MQQQLSLKLKPAEALDDAIVKDYIAHSIGKSSDSITGFHKLKQSIDARSRQQVWINVTVNAFVDEPFAQRNINTVQLQDVATANKKVIIIGAGPCGLICCAKTDRTRYSANYSRTWQRCTCKT